MAIAKGCGSSCNGIYSLIFILETDMITQWPATGIDFCGWHPWTAVSHKRECEGGTWRWETSARRRTTKNAREKVQKQKTAEPRWVFGFVYTPRKYVKSCLYSWTHLLPCLHKKLRHLASTRRTSLGFWRRAVDHLILCKLKSARREAGVWWASVPLWFCCKSKIWKLHVWWGKHAICDSRGRNRAGSLIWPVIERPAVSLKHNKKPVSFRVKEGSVSENCWPGSHVRNKVPFGRQTSEPQIYKDS